MNPRHDDDDAWVDAFSPEELADPELSALDAAVGRVLAGTGLPARPPVARGARWPLAVAALALLTAGVGLGALWPRSAPERVAVAIDPIVIPAAEPAVEEAAPQADALPPATLVPDAPVGALASDVARPAPTPPEDPVVAPAELEPGLTAASGAQFVVQGDAARLRSGRLRYVHDATHEPGVRRVDLVQLPLEIQPVGTAFQVVARRQVAAVLVEEGRVRLVHDDGTVVAALRRGQEVVAMPDLDSALGVRIVNVTTLPLESVRALVPRDCLCHPEDVVASVASLRLTRVDTPESP